MKLYIVAALVLSLVGIVAAAAGICLLGVELKLHRKQAAALAACLVGALPSLAFIVHAAVRTFLTPARIAYPVDPSAIAALWMFVAPLFFALSLRAARPLQLPRFHEVVRGGLFFGWISASFLSALAVASI